jgi:hypothetical protein
MTYEFRDGVFYVDGSKGTDQQFADYRAVAEAATQVPPEPTKADLLVQIQALMAKVEALP